MSLPYSKKVLDHFMNPQNVGKLQDADAQATEGSPACGDMVKLYLNVNTENKIIEDICFESYGCASNIATGSIITELAKGKTLEEAKQIDWKMANDALDGLPAVKVHCAVLAVDALKTAIENYEHKHGLLIEKEKTDEAVVIKRLKRVINPSAGQDVIRTKIVQDVEVENGKITVFVELPEDHQFANNIREEIIERLEPLWDIETVSVQFRDR